MSDFENNIDTRCGYAAMIGRPNVGKSTLLNRILEEKISIVTAKPQTTRNRIVAVHNQGPCQVIFLDTPGLHSPQGELGQYMVDAAQAAIADSDVCVWIIDMAAGRTEGLTNSEKNIGTNLGKTGRPIIALINKVDTVKDKANLLPVMQQAGAFDNVEEVIPICALDGQGVDLFLEKLGQMLPEAPWLYPADMLSDQAERFFVAEMIREALTELTHKEIPYHTAVVIDKFVEETKRCVIHATIFVERTSQRGIVVGKGGRMIKEIGQRARAAIEKFLRTSVELRLHATVAPGWTKDQNGLRKMGYE